MRTFYGAGYASAWLLVATLVAGCHFQDETDAERVVFAATAAATAREIKTLDRQFAFALEETPYENANRIFRDSLPHSIDISSVSHNGREFVSEGTHLRVVLVKIVPYANTTPQEVSVQFFGGSELIGNLHFEFDKLSSTCRLISASMDDFVSWGKGAGGDE